MPDKPQPGHDSAPVGWLPLIVLAVVLVVSVALAASFVWGR